MFKIFLIGIAANRVEPDQLKVISDCKLVVSSSRHQPLVAKTGRNIVPITPLQQMLENVASALHNGNVAILASGDPLFFGVGRKIIQRFGAEHVRITPALSSVQLACARLQEPWDDMHILSLHGRRHEHLPGTILQHSRTMLFTDPMNSPDRIAEVLLNALQNLGDHKLIEAVKVAVVENAGLDSERVTRGSLKEISGQSFEPLNLMLIKQPKRESAIRFGLSQADFNHSRGLITKDEVRAATLHQLRLPEGGVFWDVGAGSGSVSVAGGILNPDLQVYAIERHPEELANIKANIIKHSAFNVQVIEGAAPDMLADLPNPNRVFIGGSGGNLEGILNHCVPRLVQGGRIVVNSVLEKTARLAPEILHCLQLKVDVRRISVSRWNYGEETEKKLNPITLVTGIKQP